MSNLVWVLYRLVVGFATFAFLWWAFGPKLAIAVFLVLWSLRLELTE